MYKTPPHDDEHTENDKLPDVYPAQQRRRAAVPRRPSASYSVDEHPEIPRIKRASLHLDPGDLEAQLPATGKQGNARPATDLSRAIPNGRAKAVRRPYQPPQADPADEETDEHLAETGRNGRAYGYPSRQHKATISTQNRRYSVYEPPTTTRLPKGVHHIRDNRPLLARIQHLRHNPAVVIICLLAIALLILVPITVGAIHAYTGSNAPGRVTTTNNGQPPTLQQAPLDPHELVIAPTDTDHPAPPVFATSAYLLDADTGATLYAHNPFTHLPLLSTTKLMTAVLAIEQGNIDQQITINDTMAHQIGQLSADSALMNVKKGETYTLRDLLYGLLFVSGNDVALVIADTIGGSVDHFVAEMNQKAHALGMDDTHFMNPHGLLQAGQYSSAHDLAVLGRYSMSLPLLHKISGERLYSLAQGKHPNHGLTNENQFLWWYPDVDGGKTGYDGQSDFIQIISATRNHHHVIGVVMHTNNWWTDMRDLLNWGFDTFNWISPYDVEFQHPIPYDYLWDYFAKDKKDNTIPTADGGRYYVYTGFSISNPILSYFNTSGGLKTFGYPIKLPTVPGASVINQQFEHGTIQCNISTSQCQKV